MNPTELLCHTLILYIACYHRVSKLLSNRPPVCMEGTIPDQKQECKLEWPMYNFPFMVFVPVMSISVAGT